LLFSCYHLNLPICSHVPIQIVSFSPLDRFETGENLKFWPDQEPPEYPTGTPGAPSRPQIRHLWLDSHRPVATPSPPLNGSRWAQIRRFSVFQFPQGAQFFAPGPAA